jgi:hypothetical protein
MSPLRAQQVNAIYVFVTMVYYIAITILDIIHLLRKTLKNKNRTMDNVPNCDSYMNIAWSQTYSSYLYLCV